jgi:chain length determinant protein tyrosine kinase EpsG
MKSPVHHLATVPFDSDSSARSFIGTILMEWGKLTPDNIVHIVRMQETQNLRFGETAMRLGLITESDVQQVLAYQFEYPYLAPGEQDFSPDLVAAYDPFSPQVEMLRSIRTELNLRWFGRGCGKLAVASINRMEGASVMAANLAVVISQLGARTLLIDANLRRPRQHHIFGIKSRLGLSDILVGRAHLETICKVEGLGDLSILPAGTTPPNPQELLSRVTFAELSEALRSRFDRILIDVPAFTEGAEALTVGEQAGGMLLVVRSNHTSTADLDFVKDRLKDSGTSLVGSVLVDF